MAETLLDLYTREDIRDLGKIYRTYEFGYCPIVFSAENVEPSLKNELLELWKKAKLKVEQSFPDFCSHVWRIGTGYFKQLFYSNESLSDALLLFWNTLKELSGDRWEVLQKYYIQLSTKQVAFLNGKEFNYHTKVDIPLFNACIERNLPGIEKAIENGANVNAIDEYGRTPLALVLEADCGIEEIEKHEELNKPENTKPIIDCLDFLLSKGADINLFGFEGEDVIQQAHWLCNLKVLEYLFEHGARPDLNSNVTDLCDQSCWCQMSGGYFFACMDASREEYDWTNFESQISIMEKYGVKWYIDGYEEK